MEEIRRSSRLGKTAKKLTGVLALLVLGASLVHCSSKKVMQEDDARFKDINDEYSKMVKIAPAKHGAVKAPVQPVPVAAPPVAAPPVTGKPETAKKPETTDSEKLARIQQLAKVKKVSREPKIEDSEGFTGRRPLVDPFRENESVVLTAKYFNSEAGDLTIKVNPYKMVNGKKAYHFSMHIKTSKVFSMFYAVDNVAETFVDFENLVPLTYEMEAKESSRQKEVRTFFDWQKSEATHWEKTIKKNDKEKKKKVTWAIEPYSQNIISAIYYLRNFQLTPGKVFSFRIADAGKNMVFKGEILRKEKLKTALGELDTVVVKPTFEVDDLIKPMGDNLVWVTDDDRKYIVRVESKLKIGRLVAQVKKINPGH